MVAKLSRENAYRKGLEVYDALPAIGLMADTAITNAAISACDKGQAEDCMVGRLKEERVSTLHVEGKAEEETQFSLNVLCVSRRSRTQSCKVHMCLHCKVGCTSCRCRHARRMH